MSEVVTVLAMLLAVVVSGALTRMAPLPVPRPLVQIAMGVLIAAFGGGLAVRLEPDIFFLLFLPPLLFLDGWRIPKGALYRDGRTVLQLALGLVVFTVLGVGFFAHWLIPAMPLAVAFALAAVVSPTDPVAVSGIAERVPVPNRLMHILEGESLLNDASGLTCLRFAVAAALTGSFSPAAAFASFLWLAVGGVAIGAGVTWAITIAKTWVSRKFGEETGTEILISVLIPFAAYMLAEELGASGILAAVAAGVAMSFIEQFGRALAVTRVRRSAVWDAIQFALTGLVFVLLGEQLPGLWQRSAEVVGLTGHASPAWLVVYVLAINGALAALRFVWVWVSLKLSLARARRRGAAVGRPSWQLIAATTLAGVRGAVTLAGVLTLPFTLADGTPFPARDLAILLAAGAIILSLVAASVGLPFLLRGLELPPEPSHDAEEEHARLAAAEAAIKAVERAQHRLAAGREDADLYADAGARIMALYRRQLEASGRTGADADRDKARGRVERELRLVGLQAERKTFLQLDRTGALPHDVARRLSREIDLVETRLTDPAG
ncbi:MAG: Na+/H+ antiporter [Amaricoccus sp.]